MPVRRASLGAKTLILSPAIFTLRSGEKQVVTLVVVAKVHKINDRLTSRRRDRLADKDAADVFRLMQHTSPAEPRPSGDRTYPRGGFRVHRVAPRDAVRRRLTLRSQRRL